MTFELEDLIEDFIFIDLQWFAAADEGRTEEPSETKLKRAREEGRVAKSQELCSSLVILTVVLTLIFSAKYIFSSCIDVMKFFFTRVYDDSISGYVVFRVLFGLLAKIVLPIAGLGMFSGIIANIVQNRGWIFTTKTITPNFSKIIPNFGEYFKKTLFSFHGLFNIVKSIGKVVVLVIVGYILVKRNIPTILMVIQNGKIIDAVCKIAWMSATLLLTAAFFLLLVSIPDYFIQRREFRESMKMTKQEVKQEYKDMEGDPQVKARLMQEARRLAQQNIPKMVKESDVIITNPTHYAVGLKYYSRGDNDAPVVTIKGEDQVALFIRSIAGESNIPIVENKPLARGLYTNTEIGDIIPQEYFLLVSKVYAEILKYNNSDKL